MSTLHPSYRPTTRSARSQSCVSDASTVSYMTGTSSRSASPGRSIRAPSPAGLVPAQAFYTSSIDGIISRARNSSVCSFTSMSLQSVRSETRPASFSPMEEKEERDQFGHMLEILEPRDSVGWWGMHEVLECESLDAKIIA